MEEISRVEVRDAGKPIWEARADVEACAELLKFYGGLAPSIVGELICGVPVAYREWPNRRGSHTVLTLCKTFQDIRSEKEFCD